MNPAPSSLRSRRPLFYGLLCACIGVWGYVLLLVAQGISQGGMPTDVPSPPVISGDAPAAGPARPKPEATYRADFADPFVVPEAVLARPEAPRPRVVARAPPAPPPPLALLGIVGRTALLRDEAGATFVARAGDRVGRTHLLRVAPGHVVLRHEGRRVTLALRP
ncbi:MAG: hypothetical protein R3247_02375 [Rhodothermales bacterium]|nr:hypothetical protein [Rhodothermales bacterium]